eukprot:Nitzschia sp. Nitz4//scaffold58_size112336//28526//29972//NITZ4_004022-RA/size112336-augustus-gene-0.20-mRNA-1//-1//CDS//3329554956//6258//frame0
MKLLLPLSVLGTFLCSGLVSAKAHDEVSHEFEQYAKTFGKVYDSTAEILHRQAIFLDNVSKISLHNAKVGSSSYRMGVNQFTDRLDSELPLGYDKSSHPLWSPQEATTSRRQLKNHMELNLPKLDISDLPKSIDWRHQGQVVTPVKNQGACGSCWAFASTAVLESHIALQTGKLFSLSMQELVSCTPNPNDCGGEGGCMGSTAELAFQFVAEHGMVEEFSFGYQSYHGETVNCSILEPKGDGNLRGFSSSSDDDLVKGAVASILGFTKLPTNQYKALMIAVATIGPVAVSVAASGWGLYHGGVYDDDGDDHRVVNHLVVLMGYGTDTETGKDYWLVRNSWGPLWGEDGYIRLKRVDPSTLDDPSADCKIDDKPADGVACTKDDSGKEIVPPSVPVCGTSGILFDSSVPVGGHLVEDNLLSAL